MIMRWQQERLPRSFETMQHWICAGRSCAIALALATTGCFIEGTAGALKSGGGVDGYGYTAGVNAGFFFDYQRAVRVSLDGEGRFDWVKASDGRYSDRGGTLGGRVDVSFAGANGDTGHRWRGTGAFGIGNNSLSFQPTNYSRTWDGTGKNYNFFGGLTYDNGDDSVIFSASLGPSILYVSNDFVGNLTMFGPQARLAFFFYTKMSTNFTGGGGNESGGSTPAKYDDGWKQKQEYYKWENDNACRRKGLPPSQCK